MKKILLLLGLLCCFSSGLRAQLYGDLGGIVAEDYLYLREFVYGLNLNTNGGRLGGVMVRYAKVIDRNMYHSFSLEIVNIKHPEEQRIGSPFTGNPYVAGKHNHLFMFRPQYGRELVLFKKAEKQGVQINLIGAVGPNIGLVAPYLLDMEVGSRRVTEQFDPRRHQGARILGSASIFRSLSSAEFEIGGSLKTSITCEFGTYKSNVYGVEFGFMLDAFPNEIVIIQNTQNRNVFTSAFVSIYFGLRK